MRSRAAFILLCGIILASTPARGQQSNINQPDETLPGFKPNDVLFEGQYDNVSVYDGDTHAIIPLGPSYSLGKDFSFQLKAYSTLKFWFFEDNTSCEMTGGVGGGTKWVTRAFVSGFPTIGAAWSLSPGYVTDDKSQPTGNYSYIYVSPDGGHHPAYADGVAVDGSRLKIGCMGSPWTSCTVNFPDGTQQYFNQVLSDPAPIPPATSSDFDLGNISQALGLYQVIDAWGRVMLNVAYGSSTYTPSWGVTAIYLGANQMAPAISFSWLQSGITVGGVTWPALNSITFPTINSSPQESVAFQYTTVGITRSGADTSLTTADNCPCQSADADPSTASVAQLQTVTLKSGTTQAATFTMGYAASGGLTSLTLPMGGQVTYQLGPAQHAAPDGPPWGDPTLETSNRGLLPGPPPPAPQCPPAHLYIADTLGNSLAVVQRSAKDPVRSVTSITTYSRLDSVQQNYPTASGDGYNTRIVEVVEPTDDTHSKLTRYLFHVSDAGEIDPTRSGVELEHSVYAGATFPTGGVGSLRTIINCEDFGTTAGFCGYLTPGGSTVSSFGSFSGPQHSAGHVEWYGDKPTSTLTDKSGGTCASGSSTPCVSDRFSVPADWTLSNGFHYTTETLFSVNTTPTINRTTTTTWAPWTMSGSCLNTWGLDLMSRQTTAEAAAAAPNSVTTNYTIESCRPFYTGATTSDTTYGQLNLTATDPGGGKGTPLTRFGSVVTTKLTNTIFSDAVTYDANIHPLTVTRAGVTGKSFDVSRDLSTGLITSSRDPNTLQTNYTYDGLGRLLAHTPPGTENATQYCYFLNTDGNMTGNPKGLNLVYVKQGTTNVCGSTESPSTATWQA